MGRSQHVKVSPESEVKWRHKTDHFCNASIDIAPHIGWTSKVSLELHWQLCVMTLKDTQNLGNFLFLKLIFWKPVVHEMFASIGLSREQMTKIMKSISNQTRKQTNTAYELFTNDMQTQNPVNPGLTILESNLGIPTTGQWVRLIFWNEMIQIFKAFILSRLKPREPLSNFSVDRSES